jgi:hypothetical protein
MKNDKRVDYETRDSVLKFLSDDEVTSVSLAETTADLSDGDEYLDLMKLAQGVQRAHGTAIPMGSILPKKAVHENTWSKIVTHLEVRRAMVNL